MWTVTSYNTNRLNSMYGYTSIYNPIASLCTDIVSCASINGYITNWPNCANGVHPPRRQFNIVNFVLKTSMPIAISVKHLYGKRNLNYKIHRWGQICNLFKNILLYSYTCREKTKCMVMMSKKLCTKILKFINFWVSCSDPRAEPLWPVGQKFIIL